MNYITARYYITNQIHDRFKEILYGFEDIEMRIVEESETKIFSRYVVELTEEEITVLSLGLDPSEGVVSIQSHPHPSTALLDSAVEMYINMEKEE